MKIDKLNTLEMQCSAKMLMTLLLAICDCVFIDNSRQVDFGNMYL